MNIVTTNSVINNHSIIPLDFLGFETAPLIYTKLNELESQLSSDKLPLFLPITETYQNDN